MYTTEGRGKIPPTPVTVQLDSSDIAIAYETARRRELLRNYKMSQDRWKRGLLTGADPVVVGSLGEFAFAKWVSPIVGYTVFPNIDDEVCGDGGFDFLISGYGIQLKTAVARYSHLLVKELAVHFEGWDICVRAQLQIGRKRRERMGSLFDPGDPKSNAVEIRGWAFKNTIERLGSMVVGNAGNMNYRLEAYDLCSMKDLGSLLQARKGLS